MASPLSLTLVSALGQPSPFAPAVASAANNATEAQSEAGTVVLREDDWAALVARSGLRHSRYHNRSTVLAALAARLLLEDGTVDDDLGVISVGGPLNLNVTWDFVGRGVLAGPNFVNPLSFPNTLVSSVPTSVAALIGAHACAIAIGHDRLAFFDALVMARRLIRSGFARQMLVLAAFAGGGQTEEGLRLSGETLPGASAAIGGLLSAERPRRPHLALLHLGSRGLA